MAKALIPLDVIASGICGDLRDPKQKFSITRHLLDGYRDINLFVSHDFDVKTAVLEFDNSIEMPCDFVYETKVGVLHNGNLAVLTLDESVRHRKLKSDTETIDYLNSVWSGSFTGEGYYFYNAFRGGESLGELYGMGRGSFNAGTFSIDRKSGVMHIGSLIPQDAEIVIEYKSDGVSSGLKLVPTELKKALEYYAKSEWYADRNITQSQVNRNRYEVEYTRVKRLYNFKNALYIGSKVNESFSPTNY